MQKDNEQPERSERADPVVDRSGEDAHFRRSHWALVAGACLLFGVGLGTLDFWAPDEPRYGAIAEELRAGRAGRKGWVLLHLGGVPYTQKPPLYFWMAAGVGAFSGHVSEWAARLPSAVAGVVSVGVCAALARRLFGDPRYALLAGALLATSFRFVFSARRASLDVLLTSFELLALFFFVAATFRPRQENERDEASPLSVFSIGCLHGAVGLAALVKGPVGWLPILIIAAFLGWEGRIRDFRRIAPTWAFGLSVGPLALWAATAVLLAPPGFAAVAIGENVFGRFFAGTSHARPFYYFLYQLPADFLPWSLLLPFGAIRVWRIARNPEDSLSAAARLLVCWVLVPLLFFSLSGGKRGVYLLPSFPALAMIAALPALMNRSQARGPATTRTGSEETEIPRFAPRVGQAAAAVAVIELLLFTWGAQQLSHEKSPRPIAEAAARVLAPNERLGVYGLSPIEGAIGYYGQRDVTSLRTEADLRAFAGVPGRWILLRERHHVEFGPSLGLVSQSRFRSGRRALILAVSVEETPRAPLEAFPAP